MHLEKYSNLNLGDNFFYNVGTLIKRRIPSYHTFYFQYTGNIINTSLKSVVRHLFREMLFLCSHLTHQSPHSCFLLKFLKKRMQVLWLSMLRNPTSQKRLPPLEPKILPQTMSQPTISPSQPALPIQYLTIPIVSLMNSLRHMYKFRPVVKGNPNFHSKMPQSIIHVSQQRMRRD